MKSIYYILFIGIIFLISCEKEITIDLPQPEIKPVIEGAIEQDEYPWVFISKNAAYFDKFDSMVFVNMIDTTALVIVDDGVVFDTLSKTIDFFQFPFFKYVGNKFKGEIGKRYNLTVKTGGKTYKSTTTIPEPVHLDSLVFKPSDEADTLGYVWIYLVDPPEANYYRIFTKVIGKDAIWVHPFPSTTDDKFFNNQKAEYEVYRGRNPLEDDLYDDNGIGEDGVARWYFRTNETVAVKLTSLDFQHYNFWYSVEQQFMSDGNPFASPISVVTNIEGGALGVWGGYSTSIDTINIAESLTGK